MWLLILWAACGPPENAAQLSPPPPPPEAAALPPIPAGHWTRRTDVGLEDALVTACRASLADSRPVLLEFSAPWCLDCQTLARLEHHPGIASEAARWHRVRADVGRFDRHAVFLRAFGVDAIAHWVALAPTDCAVPPPEWPRLRQGTLELATGTLGPRTAADVVAWLAAARG